MERYDDRSLKEVPHADLGLMSCREAMIHVSEKIIKPKHGLDYFGVLVANEIDVTKDYCISDGGFIDELIPVLTRVGPENFILVQLTREDEDFSSDSRRYFNSNNLIKEYVLGSKTPIDNQYVLDYDFEVSMYRIHNNSTITSFEETLQDILLWN